MSNKAYICNVIPVKEFSNLEDTSLENTLNDNLEENIELDIIPVKKPIINYDNHYISIIIVRPKKLFDKIKNLDFIYFMRLDILTKESHIIPTYKIDYNQGFKFKKSIREKIVNEFNFKNKDILHIKNINTNKNYHNYLVLLDDNKRIDNYKNSSFIKDKSNFCWHSLISLYKPGCYEPSDTEIFIELYENDKINYVFNNEAKNNDILSKDIFKSISCII